MKAMKQSCTPENTKLATDSDRNRRSSASRRNGCSKVPPQSFQPGSRSWSQARRGNSISTSSATTGTSSVSKVARQPISPTMGGTNRAPSTPPSGTPI